MVLAKSFMLFKLDQDHHNNPVWPVRQGLITDEKTKA